MDEREIDWLRGEIEKASAFSEDAYKDSHRKAVQAALQGLDDGSLRVAEKINGVWQTHEWLKRAIILHFEMSGLTLTKDARGEPLAYDQVPLKWAGWGEDQFREARFRMAASAIARHAAYIAPRAVLMPGSFVNMGARVGEHTMIDAGARVGSCAQVGRGCHISGGAGIGGVLEPPQARPTIVEDDCFIGAQSEVAEGAIVEEGAVLSMGVFIGLSTKVIDRETGEIFPGRVPPYSVVVPGFLPAEPASNGNEQNKARPGLYCAVIVKKVDAQTRAKISPNKILRAALG